MGEDGENHGKDGNDNAVDEPADERNGEAVLKIFVSSPFDLEGESDEVGRDGCADKAKVGVDEPRVGVGEVIVSRGA